MRETAMTKIEFLNEFTRYNEQIESALAAQNFDRVVSLDVARREMLHDFTKNNSPDQDLHFFRSLEKCAEDNAKSISMMIEEMQECRRKNVTRLRAFSKYR